MTMRQVRIAELKARLSEYLRAVRSGETIAVLDRATPVAQIVPAPGGVHCGCGSAAPDAPPLHRVPLPKAGRVKGDVVRLLLEERQNHR